MMRAPANQTPTLAESSPDKQQITLHKVFAHSRLH